MQQHLIYGLVDPSTEELRYVGRSSSGLKEPKRYLKEVDCPVRHIERWVNKSLKEGVVPEIIILEELAPSKDVNDALNVSEIKWIKHYKDLGYNLTNLTDGGFGALGCIFSEKRKRKIGLANGQRIVCLNDGNEFPSMHDVAKHYGVGHSSVCSVVNGYRDHASGYKFVRFGEHLAVVDGLERVEDGRHSEASRRKVSLAQSRRIRRLDTGEVYGSSVDAARELDASQISVWRAADEKKEISIGVVLEFIDPPKKRAKSSEWREKISKKRGFMVRRLNDGEVYNSMHRAASATCISFSSVYKIVRGLKDSVKGWRFELVEESHDGLVEQRRES